MIFQTPPDKKTYVSGGIFFCIIYQWKSLPININKQSDLQQYYLLIKACYR